MAADSQVGTMIFDGRKQAIYLFTKDHGAAPTCHGECAQAWPPATSANAPMVGSGVRVDLLGTTRRTKGTRDRTGCWRTAGG